MGVYSAHRLSVCESLLFFNNCEFCFVFYYQHSAIALTSPQRFPEQNAVGLKKGKVEATAKKKADDSLELSYREMKTNMYIYFISTMRFPIK